MAAWHGPIPDGLGPFAAMAAELGDLKRLRDARGAKTIAERLFARAWSGLCGGSSLRDAALVTSANAVAAARLAGVDRETLIRVGIHETRARKILCASLDLFADVVPYPMNALHDYVGDALEPGALPAFAVALAAQPRAGATCPGKPRLVLEPPESHADHCLLVAVLGALLAPAFGADPAVPFLMGLTHHLHNAVLPDAGFTGEMLLGDELIPVMARLFDEGYAQMPPALAHNARAAMAHAADASTAEGRAFHAADVMDRVLQMRHYEQVARFRASHALDDLNLVHEGPVQAFHHRVLDACGLR